MENFIYKDILGYLKIYRSTPEEKSRFIIYIDCGNKGENKNRDKEYLLEKPYSKIICFVFYLPNLFYVTSLINYNFSIRGYAKDDERRVEKKVFFLTISIGS